MLVGSLVVLTALSMLMLTEVEEQTMSFLLGSNFAIFIVTAVEQSQKTEHFSLTLNLIGMCV